MSRRGQGRPKGGRALDGAEIRAARAERPDVSERELAERFGCTVNAIRYHLSRKGSA